MWIGKQQQCMCVRAYTHACAHIHLHVYTHVHMHVCTHTYVHIYSQRKEKSLERYISLNSKDCWRIGLGGGELF